MIDYYLVQVIPIRLYGYTYTKINLEFLRKFYKGNILFHLWTSQNIDNLKSLIIQILMVKIVDGSRFKHITITNIEPTQIPTYLNNNIIVNTRIRLNSKNK